MQIDQHKILVIDDDATLTKLLDARLSANGYEVVIAKDGAEGLEKYKKEKPDLIILDIEMPKMDGYTFVLEFKQIASLRDTPIIMLTAKEAMREIFAIEGINDYIVKPFDMDDLLNKIKKHLAVPHKKVLIVDDGVTVIGLMEEKLTNSGYDVITATNGLEGINMAQKENPDLVLLDVMMPKLDGLKVCRMLKFDRKFQNIPVVLLSALRREDDRALGREVGANAYLSKPLETPSLLQTMKELLWD
ncbi:MAG: hypothetical protein A2Z88_11565 [Omnitrophica WOR_2 bacterium GWA2_47_8]|nr:MAG: hypothetical protein A2Z88_11565 [Omnitrophica WOR_2 bacterium GWA2_47_8]